MTTHDAEFPKKRRKLCALSELASQSKVYAEKRLSVLPIVNHVVGLELFGSKLCLWWHDRESTVKSSHIDINAQLPELVVLLILLQRFSAANWGKLDILQSGTNCTTVDDHFFVIDSFHARHGGNTFTCDVSERTKHYFLKASFSDMKSDGEAAMIHKCYTLASGDSMIVDHIPTVVAAQDFPESATSKIRSLLGLPSPRPKILRILVFERLEPITCLKGQPFWKAFWDTVRVHFLLWQLGIQHRDISVGNLMHNPATGNGVLIDFDLSSYQTESTSTGCTGTIPFMALELVHAKRHNKQCLPRYRHDLESFAWVLLWIFGRYRNGQDTRQRFQVWDEDLDLCYGNKQDLEITKSFCSPDYNTYAEAVINMLGVWQNVENRRTDPAAWGVSCPFPCPPFVEFTDSFYLSCIKHVVEFSESSEIGECAVNLGIPLPAYPSPSH
ncbi:hypothetical protein C8J56DRAFT_941747 [Mycena floridula]|nr:hypothetical protein C8J56DRAFT_941747 [Mycena floridula]